MILLDSINKKTRVLSEMVMRLLCPILVWNVPAWKITRFLHDVPASILSSAGLWRWKSVITPPLRRLLKPSGHLVMYKSRNLEDLEGIKFQELLSREDEHLGLRRLIMVAQRDLMKR
jgi:hypothetical protein